MARRIIVRPSLSSGPAPVARVDRRRGRHRRDSRGEATDTVILAADGAALTRSRSNAGPAPVPNPTAVLVGNEETP